MTGPKIRTNAYGASVIYQSEVPQSSIGWKEKAYTFFEGLGSPRKEVGTSDQQAEQVYLLSNMHKAGLWEASQIAQKRNVGIAVRGTGLTAHMGIESGNPTKSQEFKNKTSKAEDLYLCDWLKFEEVGSVLHYDPRVGWTPESGARDGQRLGAPPSRHVALVSGASGTSAPGQINHVNPGLLPFVPERDWALKEQHILKNRVPQLMPLIEKGKIPTPNSCWPKVQKLFAQRVVEYLNEDAEYRPGGHYYDYVTLVGVHIRVKQRPDAMMVGDHDLFGFTDPERDTFLCCTLAPVIAAQADLQRSNGFQAQHGGIWNWNPPEAKNVAIKDVIMGAHGPGKGEPLVYFNPKHASRPVSAAFYIKGKPDCVKSIWDFPQDGSWRA